MNPDIYRKLTARHQYVLHCDSPVFALKSKSISGAKDAGLLTSFKTLKPEYAALLDDLADGVERITHNHKEK